MATNPKPCETQPRFTTNDKGEAQSVTLKRENYVKLLVDAREVDPACWPPGMEEIAGMVARLQEIEDQCISMHGEFDPEKLVRDIQDEYMDLNLVLDAISEGEPLDDLPQGSAPKKNKKKNPTAEAATCALPVEESWEELVVTDRENFA
jgi:hypothetical protein